MKLTWYGTAGFVLAQERPEKTAIAFDPFAGFPVEQKGLEEQLHSMKEALSSVPYVFITHGHLDHIYHIPYFFRNTSALIYGTETPCRTLEKRGLAGERLCRIAPGWSGEIGSFSIRAWQSRHCKFDVRLILRTVFCARFWRHPLHLIRLLTESLRYPENGEILFYQAEAGGLRIQIMGSLNLDPSQIYPTGADYLILPFQGRSDLETYAMTFIERLRPKAVLLDHCDDSFPPLSNTIETEGFCREVQKRFGISCCALKKGETIALYPEGGKDE